MRFMRLIVAVLMLLPFLSASALASSGAPNPGMQIGPGMIGGMNGVKVKNGAFIENSPYANSKGKATLRRIGSSNSTDIATENRFAGEITGLEAGDSLSLSTNCNPASVSGTGGSVSMGNGSHATVSCLSGPGSTPINVTLSGGQSISVPPGSTVTIQT